MENDKMYPISIEEFAAFIEGNLPEREMHRISELIKENDVLRAMVENSDTLDDAYEDIVTHMDASLLDVGSIEFGALDGTHKDVYYDEDSNLSRVQENTESFLEIEPYLESINLDSDSIDKSYDSINTENQNITHMSTAKTYGYQPNYELDTFDPYIYQGYNNTCAIRSQEIVLRDYGIMFSQEQLMEFAEKNGWYDPDPEYGGTDKEHVGNIIDACGIHTTRTEDATIYDIIAELRAGHRVIVGVDADELWIKNEPSLIKRLFGEAKNKADDSFRDFLGIQGANHALVVAGVNVNPLDLSDIHVTLIDPGSGDVCIEYRFKDFEQAWRDGNHSMVSTDVPAPFQYNYETHLMEPSGFSTEYMPAIAHIPDTLENRFMLSERFYDEYMDYSPEYSEDIVLPVDDNTGHLDAYEDSDGSNDNDTFRAEEDHDTSNDNADDDNTYGFMDSDEEDTDGEESNDTGEETEPEEEDTSDGGSYDGLDDDDSAFLI